MLVVIAIIGLLAAVIIVGQSTFNKNTLLTDIAYTVALSIRESESLGLSSKGVGGVSNAGYGVHFGEIATGYEQYVDIYPPIGQETNDKISGCLHPSADAGTPAERPGNCTYDPSNGELLNQYTFALNYSILKIYYHNATQWLSFTPGTVTNGTTRVVDIVFERPNTQAILTETQASGVYAVKEIVIELTSPQGGTRCVDVTQYGEITVDQNCYDITQP